jgi:hypothetical protein
MNKIQLWDRKSLVCKSERTIFEGISKIICRKNEKKYPGIYCCISFLTDGLFSNHIIEKRVQVGLDSHCIKYRLANIETFIACGSKK